MCPLGGVSQGQGHILNQLFKVGISPSSLFSTAKHIHRHLTRALLCCSNYQSLVPSIIITWKLGYKYKFLGHKDQQNQKLQVWSPEIFQLILIHTKV